MTARDGGGAGGRMRVERGIYRQANGKYAVCFMLDGKPRFRTVGYDRDVARAERRAFVEAARGGVIAAAPRLRFDTVAEWWVGRFARKVPSGERRERTLELHRYYLDRHALIATALLTGTRLSGLLGLICPVRTMSGVTGTDALAAG